MIALAGADGKGQAIRERRAWNLSCDKDDCIRWPAFTHSLMET
jgi:hypothetical protein